MPPPPPHSFDAASVRRRAEERLRERHLESSGVRTDADTQRLLHELEVHQIELEMQNAALEEARANVEAALERITDLYDFAPVGYVTLGTDGAVREANLAGAAMLGVTRSALVNRPLGVFVSPEDRAAFGAFLQHVLASRSRAHCEVSLLVDGKPPFPVELKAVPSASGHECRVALTDLTERNRAAEDRLILGKLESTGILAGGMAHDFNNLLAVIVLNLDLARMLPPADPGIAGCLEDARKTAMMARGLTQQLLTLAKGGLPARKATALPGLLQESVRAALSGSRVRCRFSIGGDLWLAMVDDGQISQVLRNVVLNAREAMAEGGEVSIRAENIIVRTPDMPALPPGDFVRVSVTDRGTGLAPEHLSRIFDPYFSTKQRGDQKGMGLGLTISRMIVQKHDGAMAVKSVPGEGSTFDIYLPAVSHPGAEPGVSAARASPHPSRILVMDDEPAAREAYRKSLQRLGHEVELVENGRAAIAACQTARTEGRPFAAVLLDLTIRNGMGALEAIPALRAIDPSVKAIVMSGYANDPVLLNHAHRGFEGALVKPFGIDSLQEVLARVLDGDPELESAP